MNRVELSGFFSEPKLMDDEHGRKFMFFNLSFARPGYSDGRIRGWLHGAVLIHRASSFRDGTEVAVVGKLDYNEKGGLLIHCFNVREVIHIERAPTPMRPDDLSRNHRITHRDFLPGRTDR